MPEFTPKKANLSYQLTFEGEWPSSVCFLGSNTRLAAGNRNGDLLVWDLTHEAQQLSEEQKKRLGNDRKPNILPERMLVGHTNGITQLLATSDGKTLVSSSLDRSVQIWDPTATASGKGSIVLDHVQRQNQAKRDKKNEQQILDAPGVELPTQASQATLEGHDDWVTGLALSQNGKHLVSGDDGNTSIVWDLAGRKEVKRFEGHSLCGVCSTAISAEGKKLFIAEYRSPRGSFDRPPAQAKIFNVEDGQLLIDLLVVKFPDVKERDNSYSYGTKWGKWIGRGFVASAFSPDGKLLAVGQGGEIGDAKVYLIDVDSGKEVRTVSNHKYGVTDVMFTRDGKYLLTAGRDTTMRVIQVSDGKEIASLGKSRGGQFKDWFYAIDISPDGTHLAAADIAGIIHIWNCS